jgi:hypothetical protein
MSGKRVRIGGGLVSDPNTIEARDCYFVSFEKGAAGNDGRTPETPMTLAGALSVAKSLNSGTKGLYGTKIYALPTTVSQDVATGVTITENNLSIEGVSLNGVMSNPSLYTNDANGDILIITGSMVEVKGLSLNAKANNVDMIHVDGGNVFKPSISGCRFYNYDSASVFYTGVNGINLSRAIKFADVSENVFIGCTNSAVLADELANAVVSKNKVLGTGISGQSITYGFYITGTNVSVDANVLSAGYLGTANQGTTGVTLVGASCISSNNCVAGFTTAITATLSRNDSTS